MVTAATPRPHDLLHLVDPAAVEPDGATPLAGWASKAIRVCPLVVVRRGRSRPGTVPVGIRGATRTERAGGTVALSAIGVLLTPEELTSRVEQFDPRLAVAQTFMSVRAILDRRNISWGPTGSVGFTLAIGAPVVHEFNDLDIVIRADGDDADPDLDLWSTIEASFGGLPCRVDAQLVTVAGTVSLMELVRRPGQALLVRSRNGPVRLADPWARP